MKVHRLRLPGRSLCSIRSNRKWCKRRGSSLQCQNCFFVYPIIDCNLKNLPIRQIQILLTFRFIKCLPKFLYRNTFITAYRTFIGKPDKSFLLHHIVFKRNSLQDNLSQSVVLCSLSFILYPHKHEVVYLIQNISNFIIFLIG